MLPSSKLLTPGQALSADSRLVPLFFLLFPLFALIAAAYDVIPPSVAYFGGTATGENAGSSPTMASPFLILVVIGLVVSILFFAFGKLINMSGRRVIGR